MKRSKRKPEERKPYLGRLMESEWLPGADGQLHAFRWYGARGGHAELSECKQTEALEPSSQSITDRCPRCADIMALPGMNERREDDRRDEYGS